MVAEIDDERSLIDVALGWYPWDNETEETMTWKVTGVNAAELEILVDGDDGAHGVVRKHHPKEWKAACQEVGWVWSDPTRVVEARDPDSLEARIDTILGDSIDIRQVKEAFGLLCAEIRELKAKVADGADS